MKLNLDNVTPTDWADALDSGKYTQQRRAQLYSRGEHCCLGVLCELGGLPGPLADKTQGAYELMNDWLDAHGLPQSGYFYGLNDSEPRHGGLTFPEIADQIRELDQS